MNKRITQKELQYLPLNFRNLLQRSAVTSSTFLITAAFNFSFLAQSTCNIHAVHQSFVISLLGIFLLFYANGKQSTKSFTFKDDFLNFRIIGMICLGVIVFLKTPYYSLFFSAAALVQLLITLWILLFISQSQGESAIWSKVIGIILAIYCLGEEKYLQESYTLLIKIFSLLIIFLLGANVYFSIQDYLQNKKQLTFIYTRPSFQIVVGPLLVMAIFSNLLIFSLKVSLSHQSFTLLIEIQLYLTCLLFVILYFFSEQILLLCWCPKYRQDQTLFKSHFRHYQKQYYLQTCEADCQWKIQGCVLCQQMATVVNFPCGHLVLCLSCHQKTVKVKNYSKCLICMSLIFRSKQIDFEKMSVREGYQRKFFIEKTLHRNQVRAKFVQ